MSRYYSYLNTATTLVQNYKGEMPLQAYLKNIFSREKKYGSKDRKLIAALCYYYYRLGHIKTFNQISERIIAGLFLCEDKPGKTLEILEPALNEKAPLPLREKLDLFPEIKLEEIFPFSNHLSDGIDSSSFSTSFLIQPKLFIRIRPGKELTVLKKLELEAISYTSLSETCLALDNGTKIQEILDVNKEVVVQDYNSQNVGKFLDFALNNSECPDCKVWDCCAASGGKSIMAYDLKPSIDLTVSDVRPSILRNLLQRFSDAGINTYKSFIADLRNLKEVDSDIGDRKYNLVICDAPCSGSGTWSRTPEQLYFFKEEEIKRFSQLQKEILRNVVLHIKDGGQLLYITCSVFKEENEHIVEYIQDKLHLKLTKMELLKGYNLAADTMFAALFTKPS